jgi:hypothetical protein
VRTIQACGGVPLGPARSSKNHICSTTCREVCQICTKFQECWGLTAPSFLGGLFSELEHVLCRCLGRDVDWHQFCFWVMPLGRSRGGRTSKDSVDLQGSYTCAH